MKLYIWCLLIPAGFLLAEEEAPARRRPRIRVYDQEANVMPVMQPVDDRNTAEAELDKKIRSEIGAPSQGNHPVDMLSIMPALNNPSMNNRMETADEDEESWITPMDFLLEEDQLPSEELDLSADNKKEENTEMEIVDWEELQKSMIKDALQKKEPEMTDEEMEEMEEMLTEREKEAVKTSDSGGLEMEEISPLQELSQTQDDLGGSRMSELSIRESGNFVPVLPSARQMNGEVYKPELERNPELELSGSQRMLNEIKEKWAKPSDTATVPRRGSFEMPAVSREHNLPRSTFREGSLSGFSTRNSAVSPLPATQLPAVREPARTQAPPPPARRQPDTIQGSDYRFRSTLGVPSGF